MGFLDHSTNNIIVDAVLTDAGRRALARNDGSFQVHQFALGDDEVDYKIITNYGRTVGKEKIEKNTVVMEALTAGSLGLKNKLTSINNESIAYFPELNILAGGETNPAVVSFVRNSNSTNNKTATINIAVQGRNDIEIDPQLKDSSFRVELNHIFLKIDGDQPDIIYTDNIAVYEVSGKTGTGSIAATSEFSLSLKGITDTAFNIYSATGNYIKTYVKVSGINSGLTKTFEVRINDTANA